MSYSSKENINFHCVNLRQKIFLVKDPCSYSAASAVITDVNGIQTPDLPISMQRSYNTKWAIEPSWGWPTAHLTWPFEREAEVYKHSSFALVDIPWLTVQVHVHKKYTTTCSEPNFPCDRYPVILVKVAAAPSSTPKGFSSLSDFAVFSVCLCTIGTYLTWGNRSDTIPRKSFKSSCKNFGTFTSRMARSTISS